MPAHRTERHKAYDRAYYRANRERALRDNARGAQQTGGRSKCLDVPLAEARRILANVAAHRRSSDGSQIETAPRPRSPPCRTQSRMLPATYIGGNTMNSTPHQTIYDQDRWPLLEQLQAAMQFEPHSEKMCAIIVCLMC
jgi:hypothetical protein